MDLISQFDFDFLKEKVESFYKIHLQQDLVSIVVEGGNGQMGKTFLPMLRFWIILCSVELRPFFLRRDSSVGKDVLDTGA